jgi:hypothetical protein
MLFACCGENCDRHDPNNSACLTLPCNNFLTGRFTLGFLSALIRRERGSSTYLFDSFEFSASFRAPRRLWCSRTSLLTASHRRIPNLAATSMRRRRRLWRYFTSSLHFHITFQVESKLLVLRGEFAETLLWHPVIPSVAMVSYQAQRHRRTCSCA